MLLIALIALIACDAVSVKTCAQKSTSSIQDFRRSTGSIVTIRGGGVPPSLPPIVLAAATTGALMYPVDVLRALKMSSMSKVGPAVSMMELIGNYQKQFGVRGFLTQGLAPELIKATISRSLKFFLFPIVHMAITDGKDSREGTLLTQAAAGVLATIPETLFILPLEVAKLTLQLDTQGKFGNSMVRVMRHLVHNHGASALFVGFVGVQARQALWTGCYFAVVGACTESCERFLGRVAGCATGPGTTGAAAATLLGGFAAGFLGACLNNPADVVRTVLQRDALAHLAFGQPSPLAHAAAGTAASVGPLSALFRASSGVVERRGVGGLYAGIGFKACHLGGSGALMNFLLPLYKQLLKPS